MASNYNTWDPLKMKILADDKRLSGFAPGEMFEVQDDGILITFNVLSENLNNFNPTNIKAIYFDQTHTIVVKMKVDRLKMLPVKIGAEVPVVPVKLFGSPKINFTD